MIATIETYRLKMNNGTEQTFVDLDDALDWALRFEGIHSHYETDDGRWFLYASDEDNEADEHGGAELGAIVLEVEEEVYPELDGPRGWYCSDRTCGATDCRRCYP